VGVATGLIYDLYHYAISTLLVTRATGTFTHASGTILRSGTLNESTGEFDASFSGAVSTAPEPAALCLICIGLATSPPDRKESRKRCFTS
jgi:hypothetical protein